MLIKVIAASFLLATSTFATITTEDDPCPLALAIIATDRLNEQLCTAVSEFDLATIQYLHTRNAQSHVIDAACNDYGNVPFLQDTLLYFDLGLQCLSSTLSNHTQLLNGNIEATKNTETYIEFNNVPHQSTQHGQVIFKELKAGSCQYKIKYAESFSDECTSAP